MANLKFKNVKFSGTILPKCEVEDVVFDSCDLTGINFEKSSLFSKASSNLLLPFSAARPHDSLLYIIQCQSRNSNPDRALSSAGSATTLPNTAKIQPPSCHF